MGIIFGELHTLVFGWSGVQGNMLQTDHAEVVSTTLSREAGRLQGKLIL